MCELEQAIGRYLDELVREGSSPHTLEAYAGDLRAVPGVPFAAGNGAAGAGSHRPADAARMDGCGCIGEHLSAVSIRRKLAAVRGLFRFLQREGVVAVNVARLLRTPKAPQKLPEVLTPETDQRAAGRRGGGQAGAAASGARPRHFRDALRLRRAGKRAGGVEPGGYRPRGTLDARARQGPQGAPGAAAAPGRRSAGAVPGRAAGGARRDARCFSTTAATA